MDRSFVKFIIIETAKILSPLKILGDLENSSLLFEELGWQGVSIKEQLANDLQNLVSGLTILSEILTEIEDSDDVGDYLKLLEQTTEVFILLSRSLPRIVNAIEQLPNISISLSQLTTRLFDYLVYIHLRSNRPKQFTLLHLLGIVEEDLDGSIPIKVVHWDRLPTLVASPIDIPNEVYNWNSELNEAELFTRIDPIIRSFQLPGGLYRQFDAIANAIGRSADQPIELRLPITQSGEWPDEYNELSLNISALDGGNTKKGLAIYPVMSGQQRFETALGENWEVQFETNASSGGGQDGFALQLRPPANFAFVGNLFSNPGPPDPGNAPHIEFLIRRKGEGGGYTLFETGNFHIGLKSIALRLIATLAQKDDELAAELEIDQLGFSFSTGDGDGFIQNITSGVELRSLFDLTLGLSNLSGVYFRGSGDLEINIPTHLPIGPIEVEVTHIIVRIQESISFTLAVSFNADLGPLKATIGRVGLNIPLGFPDDRSGNLGPVDIGIGFTPPNRVGLSLNAGVVKGGGYLDVNSEKGEYSGALELVFSGFLGLNAIGIITTKTTDSPQGFSLLLLISTDFGAGFQLGLGFKISKVGGLIGLNRAMNESLLAEGMRSGAVNSIMFPTNVVENISRILSDIRGFFPPQKGHFLIGPMAELAWGTPTLVSLSLGLLFEIRTTRGSAVNKAAIVGVLKIVLPDEDTTIIRLQVNFIGVINFSKKFAFFFASLYDSRIAFVTLNGELGLLIAWGRNANFVVSVGGFHPRYTPPSLPFPTPVRLGFYIINTSWARIGVEGYFAVTSNTVQFGARAEMRIGTDSFNIYGHFGFDALIQFSPFFFSVGMSYEVSVKVFGAGLFSIQLRFLLEGPGRWRAKGYGKISVLFFSIKVSFDEKWGKKENTELPPIRVIPLLEAEFEKTENWQPILPHSNHTLVTLREIPPDLIKNNLIIHPHGKLLISQRFIPLGLTLDKVGHQKPADGKTFDLSFEESELKPIEEKRESFARAQFKDLSKAQKLSSPGFEQLRAGAILSFKGARFQTSQVVKRSNRFELVTIDTGFRRRDLSLIRIIRSLFDHFLLGSAAFIAPISEQVRRETEPIAQEIEIQLPGFTIVHLDDNIRFEGMPGLDIVEFSSFSEAEQSLNEFANINPQAAEELHIVPNFEEVKP